MNLKHISHIIHFSRETLALKSLLLNYSLSYHQTAKRGFFVPQVLRSQHLHHTAKPGCFVPQVLCNHHLHHTGQGPALSGLKKKGLHYMFLCYKLSMLERFGWLP